MRLAPECSEPEPAEGVQVAPDVETGWPWGQGSRCAGHSAPSSICLLTSCDTTDSDPSTPHGAHLPPPSLCPSGSGGSMGERTPSRLWQGCHVLTKDGLL